MTTIISSLMTMRTHPHLVVFLATLLHCTFLSFCFLHGVTLELATIASLFFFFLRAQLIAGCFWAGNKVIFLLTWRSVFEFRNAFHVARKLMLIKAIVNARTYRLPWKFQKIPKSGDFAPFVAIDTKNVTRKEAHWTHILIQFSRLLYEPNVSVEN